MKQSHPEIQPVPAEELSVKTSIYYRHVCDKYTIPPRILFAHIHSNLVSTENHLNMNKK